MIDDILLQFFSNFPVGFGLSFISLIVCWFVIVAIIDIINI